jgi:hypothetical protein
MVLKWLHVGMEGDRHTNRHGITNNHTVATLHCQSAKKHMEITADLNTC